jgi:formylglycine-generating enzyme required for sulfatase activity
VIGACVAIIALGFGAEALVRAMKRPPPAPAASASAAPSPSPIIVAAAPPSAAPSASTPKPPAGDMVPVTDALLVDRTEVTVRSYKACVAAGACAETYKRGSGYSENDPVRREWICNYHRKGREDHPINCINYNQATAYCAYAGKRLPTGDEWTRAARGDGARKYPWGDTMPRCREVVFARYGPDNFGCSKQPVGTMPADSHEKTASPAGALDMAGSLWEWTTERSARGFPILRGGSWDSPESGVTIDSRLEQSPGNGDVTLGFRCVRDVGG